MPLNGFAELKRRCIFGSDHSSAHWLSPVHGLATQVHEGPCANIKRHKLDVDRVGKGTECGVLLEGFAGFQQGDVLQCIELEMVAPGKEAIAPKAQAQYG